MTSWNQDSWVKLQQPQICGWYHSNGRKHRGTKGPIDEGEGGESKSGLKLKIKKSKIKAFSPYTTWQVTGENVEVVTEFLFLGSKTRLTLTAAMKSEDICFLVVNLRQT